MKDLADNLRSLRESRGLTQTELGARAGIAAASVSHFETGQRTPSLESLVKLAEALRVSTDALLGREPLENAAQLDPIFLRAAKADSQTLDTIRRITATLLADAGDR
ncbi:MAG: helix-turn-helix domain-containing protein [Gemmatimonadaceae bacterium]|nr:helix-turn-helix domain-containing protein [Gemmatimonadaceae bacterium]